jgi:hypothetical protein
MDILLHLANFAAPALALALLMPLAGSWLGGKTGARLVWWAQVGIHLLLGLTVLLASLWWWGRDGKMASYAALVLVVASSQWAMARGWQR